jgi:membrane-bound metal-dependent hydrolase YbcI (DUF457 family)
MFERMAESAIIGIPVPSPIGHALAGIAVALSTQKRGSGSEPGGFAFHPLALACVALAVLPDADLLYPPFHRSVTHSVGATLLVIIVAAGVTGWVKGRIDWRIVLTLGAAHASHLLTDWLGTDRNYAPYGIQMFWPFDDGWYVSRWDVFPPVERRHPFSAATIGTNLAAAVQEIVILGPIVVAVWLVRRRTGRRPA